MHRLSTLSLLFLVTATGCTGKPDIDAVPVAAPKVILIIGDGMDDQQITIARNYLVGSNGRLVMDGMPYRGSVQVQTVDESDAAKPVYVGDSASGATALASGVVTSIGRVGTAAKTDGRLDTILELASAAGIATGIVTSARISDATPAAFVAHIDERYCQNPRAMREEDKTHPQYSTDCTKDYVSNGGRGSVAEQIAASRIDIILGGGFDDFDQPVDGTSTATVLDAARANKFTIVRSPSELAAAASHDKIMGLFAPGALPVRLRGTGDAVAQFIQRNGTSVQWPEPFSCESEPAFQSVPTLAEMTEAALLRLDQDPQFVLMIESASIDDQAHYWRTCGHIGEVGQLDESLQAALDYAKSHPETLVLVTADHGHAAQLIPEISELAPQNYASPGRFARVRTPEGGIMGINYASNDSPDWEEHSGVQVPFYASGPGVDKLPIHVRQVDVFNIMASHLNLTKTPGDRSILGR